MERYTLSALVVIALAGCTDGTAETKEGSTHPATIEGSARRTDGGPQDAQITVLHVQADGSIQEDNNGGTSTDAEGRYVVDVGVLGEGEANLIVEAVYSDGATASVLVTGTVREGDDRVAPPMIEETRAEANLFVELVVSGDLEPDSDGAALIRAFIDAEAAAAYDGAEQAEQQIVATATAAAIASWEGYSERAGDAGVALDAYISALIEADEDADGEADSGGQGSVDAAVILEATWSASGFSDADLAYAMAAAAEAHLHMSEGERGDAISSSAATMAELRASLMAEVVSGAWSEAGDGDSGEEAEASGDDLIAEISALADASVDAMGSGWDEATDAYATQILVDLAAALGVEGSAALADAVDIAVSAQAQLSSGVASASDEDAEAAGEAIAEAMASYEASVRVEVQASLMASGSFDEAQAEAIAEVVGQLYAHAE